MFTKTERVCDPGTLNDALTFHGMAMGWILTKKKKKRRAKARTKPHAQTDGSWASRLGAGAAIKALAVIVVLAGAAFAWRQGEQALVRYDVRTHEAPITADRVLIVQAPAWMSKAVRLELAQVVAGAVSDNPLDGRGLRLAAANLSRVAWVSHVDQVRRLPDQRIEVVAEYRQPVAVVRARDGYHLVDVHGVRLPGLYYRNQVAALDLPLITGVAVAPPTRPGEAWSGPGVQAALDLITLVADKPYFDQIKAFDVSERDTRRRLRLVMVTDRGMVRWGLPPGQERAVEPDANTKLKRLARLVAARGSIDAGGRIVDIFGPTIELSQPTMTKPATVRYTW